MNKKLVIVLFLVVSLFFVNGCTPQDPASCNDDSIKPCDGNNLCEEGEYGLSDDCPDCEDYNRFTKGEYDYSEKKCKYTKLTKQEAIKKCTEEEDSEIRITWCFSTAAYNLEDVSICEEILGDRDEKNDCIFKVALKTENVDMCKNFCKEIENDELRDNCYEGNGPSSLCIESYAKSKIDYSTCENIGDQGLIHRCFGTVYKASNKYKIEPCEGVSAQNKVECLDAVEFQKKLGR